MVPIKIRLDNDDHYAGGNSHVYIVVHDTGNKTDSDEGNANYFCTGSRDASANYFVDDDSITQVVKDTDGAFHCGDGHGEFGITNRNSIGVEQCRINNVVTAKTEANCMDMVRVLMARYKIPASRVVRHYDCSHKNCPSSFNLDGKWTRWTKFKAKLTGSTVTPVPVANDTHYRVRKSWADVTGQIGAFTDLANAKACVIAHPGYKVYDIKGVQVYPIIVAPKPTVTVMYRVILDGKQTEALSTLVAATAAVKKAVDSNKAVLGSVQRNTDSVTLFSYKKSVVTPVKPVTPAKPIVVPVTPTVIVSPYILGFSECTVDQMAKYLTDHNATLKVSVTAKELAQIFLTEGLAEGVRGDLAFAQSLHETADFNFGGDVKPEQNNFAGIGTVGGGVVGASFPDINTGVRAQIQHLKGYSTTLALKNTCVDPRYTLMARGTCTTLNSLAGHWAVPGYNTLKYTSLSEAILKGESYGQVINTILEGIKSTVVIPATPVIPVVVAPVEEIPADTKSKIKLIIEFIKKLFGIS